MQQLMKSYFMVSTAQPKNFIHCCFFHQKIWLLNFDKIKQHDNLSSKLSYNYKQVHTTKSRIMNEIILSTPLKKGG